MLWPNITVFVSYSRNERAIADALVLALDQAGFRMLIDRRSLPYGEQWQAELVDLISQADTVIWLLSLHSVTSKWCNWEIDEVHKQSKQLVPVRIGDVKPEDLPRQLGQIHILPVEGSFEIETHLPVLVTTLGNDWKWLKDYTRLLGQARQWILKDRSDRLLLRERDCLLEMINGEREWSYLGGRFQSETIKQILEIDIEKEHLNWYHIDTAIRYWQRRAIDGAADEVFAALEAMMAIYDPVFLENAPRPKGNPPHLPATGDVVDQRSDPSKRWLPEPPGPELILIDVVVIE